MDARLCSTSCRSTTLQTYFCFDCLLCLSFLRRRLSVPFLVDFMMDGDVEDVGFRVGTKRRCAPKTKDRTASRFWTVFEETLAVCKVKADNPKWWKRKFCSKITSTTSSEHNGVTSTEV